MGKYGFSLIAVVLFIFSLGAIMVFDTTAAEVLDRALDRSTHYIFLKQLAYATVSLGCAAGFYFLGYENTLRLSGLFLLITTVLLVLVFVPGIGQQINGANRWINVAGTSLQPSEFAKCFLPLYAIHMMRSQKKMELKFFVKLVATLLVPIGLILIEPDNGTVAIIFMTMLILFVLMRIRFVYWALPLCVCLVVGGVVAAQMKHVPDRIRVYLHPEMDLKGKGHQPHQARIAAGSGGLFGKGIGESLQKMDYLPEARSDYIAAIFAEEFGFMGILGLIMLYMTIGGLGFLIAANAQDMRGFYVASVITFLICFQAFLNLGVVSGLLPSKGTNLPFFSHGGSSLLMNFISMGLLLSIARYPCVKTKKL